MRRERIGADLSDLPTYGYGPVSPIWWGTLAFIILEGMGFVLAIGTYLYLSFVNANWPLDDSPDLILPTILTVVLLASAIPNAVLDKKAHEENRRGVRIWITVMAAIGIAALVLRGFEFTMLNTRWDTNAYGSIQWFLLGLHTAHLATDVGDTLVLNALMLTRHAKGKRFSDVSDNCFYWYFVTGAWLPIYALVYWAPRL